MGDDVPLVVAIVGPTCTGKTALSLHLSEQIHGEVIGCDSRTIYKYMDIGTAKPSIDERKGIPHHMFDLVEPSDSYTVAQYKENGRALIKQIHERGGTPLVVGGTGLYARALLEGLQIPPVEPQPTLREELIKFADDHGNLALHDRLRQLDPVSADKLNPNDRFRVVRAIEVSTILGVPFSQATAREDVPFRVQWIGLTAERSTIRDLLQKRMQVQLQLGLVDEVRSLYDTYGACRALMNGVNYKEFIEFFHGRRTFDEAVDDCIVHSYQLARRQMMWFKTNNAINWFNIDSVSREVLHSQAENLVLRKP